MLISLKGIYRNGQVELAELPRNISSSTPVIVTFLETNQVDLKEHGIDEVEAAALRASLATFPTSLDRCAEDWDSPEMDIYDNYEVQKNQL